MSSSTTKTASVNRFVGGMNLKAAKYDKFVLSITVCSSTPATDIHFLFTKGFIVG